MAKLFFVHTPLSLFVAQNIVLQEHSANNVLIIRNVEDSSSFSDAYHILIIDELWGKIYKIEDSRKWRSKTISTLRRYIKNERFIHRIIKSNSISKVYLGDINDLRYRLEYLRFSSMGLNITIFEEGISHYRRQLYINFKKVVLGSLFVDFFVSFPKIHLGYLKYLTNSEIHFLTNTISTRYSILPQKEVMPFDIRLYVTNRLSVEMRSNIDTITNKLRAINGSLNNMVLFASQPLFMRGFICDPIYKSVLNSKFDYLHEYLRDKLIVIKFHPRETERERKVITNFFSEKGLRYYILETFQSIPLEVYLQNIRFMLLITYSSSSVAYNGYVYDYVPSIILCKDYLERLEKDSSLPDKQRYIIEVKEISEYYDFLAQFQTKTNDPQNS